MENKGVLYLKTLREYPNEHKNLCYLKTKEVFNRDISINIKAESFVRLSFFSSRSVNLNIYSASFGKVNMSQQSTTNLSLDINSSSSIYTSQKKKIDSNYLSFSNASISINQDNIIKTNIHLSSYLNLYSNQNNTINLSINTKSFSSMLTSQKKRINNNYLSFSNASIMINQNNKVKLKVYSKSYANIFTNKFANEEVTTRLSLNVKSHFTTSINQRKSINSDYLSFSNGSIIISQDNLVDLKICSTSYPFLVTNQSNFASLPLNIKSFFKTHIKKIKTINSDYLSFSSALIIMNQNNKVKLNNNISHSYFSVSTDCNLYSSINIVSKFKGAIGPLCHDYRKDYIVKGMYSTNSSILKIKTKQLHSIDSLLFISKLSGNINVSYDIKNYNFISSSYGSINLKCNYNLSNLSCLCSSYVKLREKILLNHIIKLTSKVKSIAKGKFIYNNLIVGMSSLSVSMLNVRAKLSRQISISALSKSKVNIGLSIPYLVSSSLISSTFVSSCSLIGSATIMNMDINIGVKNISTFNKKVNIGLNELRSHDMKVNYGIKEIVKNNIITNIGFKEISKNNIIIKYGIFRGIDFSSNYQIGVTRKRLSPITILIGLLDEVEFNNIRASLLKLKQKIEYLEHITEYTKVRPLPSKITQVNDKIEVIANTVINYDLPKTLMNIENKLVQCINDSYYLTKVVDKEENFHELSNLVSVLLLKIREIKSNIKNHLEEDNPHNSVLSDTEHLTYGDIQDLVQSKTLQRIEYLKSNQGSTEEEKFNDSDVSFKGDNVQEALLNMYLLVKDKFGPYWGNGLKELEELDNEDATKDNE